MTQEIKNKKVLNPRTLSFIKYILTLAYVIFYTMPALGFIDSLSKLKIAHDTLLKIQIILTVFGIICMGIYFVLRTILHRRSTYSYNKSENIQLILFITFCILILILSVAYSFVEINLRGLTTQIMFYVFEPIIIGFGIGGSMLEQRTRINEQITIYNLWYESLENEEKSKEDNTKNKKTKSNDGVKIINDEKVIEKEIKNKSNPFMDDEGSDSND